ncbi:hypothetical protein SAY87_000030 [Trapa incisa]|uniref:Uncharacterized protein n=1 Tax=Trapa incisa TaxID=236973 RepID=A0AAN7JFW9_9MYRT|nr:hypothetical protein SAY87_000030 [Trapa incisa]
MCDECYSDLLPNKITIRGQADQSTEKNTANLTLNHKFQCGSLGLQTERESNEVYSYAKHNIRLLYQQYSTKNNQKAIQNFQHQTHGSKSRSQVLKEKNLRKDDLKARAAAPKILVKAFEAIIMEPYHTNLRSEQV